MIVPVFAAQWRCFHNVVHTAFAARRWPVGKYFFGRQLPALSAPARSVRVCERKDCVELRARTRYISLPVTERPTDQPVCRVLPRCLLFRGMFGDISRRTRRVGTLANGLMLRSNGCSERIPARFDSSFTPRGSSTDRLTPERCDLWRHVTLLSYRPRSDDLVLPMLQPRTATSRPFAIVRPPAPAPPSPPTTGVRRPAMPPPRPSGGPSLN